MFSLGGSEYFVPRFPFQLCPCLGLLDMEFHRCLLFSVVLCLHHCPLSVWGSCPCSDASLCEPVKSAAAKTEVLGWSIDPKVWKYYDWEVITTVGVFRAWDSDADEMLCHAHSKNVRVVLPGNFPVANLTSEGDRKRFVDDIANRTTSLHTDGVNFDVEDAIAAGSAESRGLVALINETRTALLRRNPRAQVTADVAWSPDCIDGRCYDVKAMAAVTDFLAVMAYDERSQIFQPQPCIAMANSPVAQTFAGVQKYLDLGIGPEKLLLGQPWYGYDYPCQSMDVTTFVCTIAKVPFRGAPCSDAAGKQFPFSWMLSNMKASNATRQWNREQQAPFYNYIAPDSAQHQVWYDDLESLQLKYHRVRELKLRGVAFWTVDYLDYAGDAEARELAKKMWDAIKIVGV